MRKTLIVFGIVVVFFAVGVWLFLANIDSVAKGAIEKQGGVITKVSVNLNEIQIAPQTGNGKIRDFVMGNPAGFHTPYAVSFADATLKLDVQSLTTKLFIIHELNIMMPDINIEQNAAGNNIHIIEENIKTFINEQLANTSAQPNRFIIESLAIHNAKLHVSAPSIQADLITIPLADIQLLNIGKENGGLPAADVLNIVMQQINVEVAKAIQSRGLEKVIDINLLTPKSLSLTDRIRNFFAR
jgi:uncharacterized protein involved in outer membrane biogenesis